MAEDIEQPGVSSTPEEVIAQEVPSPDAAPVEPVETAPEAEAPKPQKSGAKERIAELVADRNRERQEKAEARREAEAYRERLAAYERSQQAPDEYANDPFMQELRAQRAQLEEMRRDNSYVKDVRAREEFWSDHSFVDPEIVEAVETRLSDFRAKGMDKISREDLLKYEVGNQQLSSLRTKVKAPAPTPAVNRVAVVEGGATARPQAGSKNPEDMTLAELRVWMKGKSF
jgi:hypothetical protein